MASGIFWVGELILRGSGYLGYVDSKQGEKNPISVGYTSPNPRVINLHITSYIQYPEPLSSEQKERFQKLHLENLKKQTTGPPRGRVAK